MTHLADEPTNILLATYNGAAHLDEQLSSLLTQTYPYWSLLIRDDGSVDGTQEIIQRYAHQYPEKIRVIQDGEANLGASQNFARLMKQAEAPYILFCDQDDVWLPNKIALSMQRMLELEKLYGSHTPLLVHTDLKVVDKDLDIIAESFWKYQKLDPAKASFNRVLVQNVVTGCTVMINKALRDLALPIPAEAVMHDWWLTLVTAAFSYVDYINEPTILYRQHGKNDVGAKHWNFSYVLQKALTLYNTDDLKFSLLMTQRQASVFVERYKGQCPEDVLQKALCYSTLNRSGFFLKRYHLFQHRFYKIGFARNLGLFLRI